MRKIGLFALMTTLVSLGAFADTVVTSKTYVDAKVQAQGSTTGSILSASSPDDKAPSSKAVYTALQGIDGATPYTGTGLISVNDHTISTTAQVNVLEGVQVAGSDLTIDANKKVNLGAAAGKAVDTSITAGSTSTDVPTTAAVAAYVANQPGATAYTGGNLITVNDHEISTTAQVNVLEGVQVNGSDLTIDANKKVNLGAAAGKAVETAISSTAANNTDAEVPTAKAVYDYVNPIQTAVTALQSCTHTCTSSDPTNAPNACDLITINCVETGA